MKCAVIYYSHTGNAGRIAEAIRARFAAELFFVEPEVPYGSFVAAVARVVREHARAEDPPFRTEVADFSRFDLIFLGFPVWAGEMPRFLRRYVRSCDLSGKTVAPFAVAMGTGKDSALRSVRALLPDSTIAPYYYANLREKPDLDAWLDAVAAKCGA